MVVFLCLYIASFLKIDMHFDLGTKSARVIIKMIDVDEIVK